MLIDTHTHINFNAFKDDGDEVVRRSLDNDVWMVIPSSQVDTSRRAVEYAERWNHPGVWAAIGLHPIHLEELQVDEAEVGTQFKFKTRKEEFDRNAYESLLSSKKVVALGEIGLDYWRKPKTTARKEAYIKLQKDTLLQQLDLAQEYKLPVILHCRVAHNDLLEIIKNHPITKQVTPPGVIHSYTGDKTQLKEFLDLGYYIGCNGIIFKLDLEDVIKATPIDRIVLETDSPYLTPPQEGDKRNEPIYVKYVAERIAELKKISFEEVADQTTQNAKTLFQI